MIEILYGPYGTGKDEYIVDKIRCDVENGRRAYWLVPEQRALSCERTIASSLPPEAQLLCEVLNFSRLCDKAFRLYGGLKYNYISPSGKNLIMYRALCEVGQLLHEYKPQKGHERGCVALFLDAIGELKSYAVSPSDLLRAVDELGENKRLRNRILDLVCVFEVYERILSERFDDPYDNLLMLKEKLAEHKLFEGASVYISSFYGFTGAQLDVLRRIFAQADNVTIALDLARSDFNRVQFSKLTLTAKKIMKIASEVGEKPLSVDFTEDIHHSSPSLAYLSKNIWCFDAPPCNDATGITLVRPDDEFDECDIVASKIKELVMRGARYGEIAVVVRSTDTYRGIIDYSFEKYDIPFYMSVSSDVSSKPLVKMIYSAIGATESWGVRELASYMRSGYADVDSEEADELESYMYRWGIYGKRFENDDFWSANPDGYVTEPTLLQMERLSKINEVRHRLISQLSPLKSSFERGASASELCRVLHAFLMSIGIKDKLREEIATADKSEAMELTQLHSAILSALEDIVTIMPNEVLTQDAFLSALSYVLADAKVGSIPTGEDNVTIGEADSLRADKIKYAFVLGVCEGLFPATVSGSTFFSDSDKIELEGANIFLSEPTDVRADNELATFKSSIALPSCELVVSSPRGDIRGNKREPSIAYNRIIELFPSLRGTDEQKISVADKLYTKRVAKEHASGKSDYAIAVRELLGISTDCFDFSNEGQKISPAVARELFGKSIYLSQSKIEKFVNCHFEYYCSYLLSLKDSEKISFGSREVGVLAHAVFEIFLRRVKRTEDGLLDFSTLGDDEIKDEVDKITEEYINLLCAGGEPSSRLRHLFNRLKANILIYIKELAIELAQSKFVPELFELKFSNDKDGVAPMSFDAGDGATITLSGIVDRVDLYRTDEKVYLRVVDYKTGEKRFSMRDVNHGLELQLLIYLFTLCKMKDGAFKDKLAPKGQELCPAGVLYFPMRLGKSRVDSEVDLSSDEASEAEVKAVSGLVKRNGIFLNDNDVILAQDSEKSGHYVPRKTKWNEELFLDENGFEELFVKLNDSLHKIGAELLSGDASASPLKFKGHKQSCEYCEHKAVCRRRSV